MDLEEYISDYVRMLKDNEERTPTRKELAQEISESLEDTDYGVTATPEQIEWYLEC